MEDLQPRRDRIRSIDRKVIELLAERLRLAREVGEVKRAKGLPIRNYSVEAEAIQLARSAAAELGVDPQAAEEVISVLIAEAVRTQEEDVRRTRRSDLSAGRALVVGGGGNMGRWFADFLDSKGYAVHVLDPRAGDTYPRAAGLEAASDADLVLVATPPAAIAGVLDALPATRALVLDISSLKSPCLDALRRSRARGLRVTSVHPMWGPSAKLLAGKNLVVCGLGDADADAEARALFADTAAKVVDLPADAHDAAMAYTLGLPHALNLAFGRVLSRGPALDDLADLAGPTFQKQAKVAAEVAAENKDLYHQIQRLNAHTPEVFAALRRAIDDLEKAVEDPEAFRAYMAACEQAFLPARGTRADDTKSGPSGPRERSRP